MPSAPSAPAAPPNWPLQAGTSITVQVVTCIKDVVVVSYETNLSEADLSGAGDASASASPVEFTGALMLHRQGRLVSHPVGVHPAEGFENRLRVDNPRDYAPDSEEYKKTAIYKRHTYFNEDIESKENLFQSLKQAKSVPRLRARNVICHNCKAVCNEQGENVRASARRKMSKIVIEKRDPWDRKLTLRPVLKPLRPSVVARYTKTRATPVVRVVRIHVPPAAALTAAKANKGSKKQTPEGRRRPLCTLEPLPDENVLDDASSKPKKRATRPDGHIVKVALNPINSSTNLSSQQHSEETGKKASASQYVVVSSPDKANKIILRRPESAPLPDRLEQTSKE